MERKYIKPQIEEIEIALEGSINLSANEGGGSAKLSTSPVSDDSDDWSGAW